MAQKNINNLQPTTLLDDATGVNATDTAFTTDGNTDFPTAPFSATIGTEAIMVTSTGTGTNWTVVRGIDGTTAAAHADNAEIALKVLAHDFGLIKDETLNRYYAQGDIYLDGNFLDTTVFLDNKPGTADTIDDDFDSSTLDAKWTVTEDGTLGSVGLLAAPAGPRYDLTTRPGWLMVQPQANGDVITLRQTYTLADGESLVAMGAQSNNRNGTRDGDQSRFGIFINTNDNWNVDSSSLGVAWEQDTNTVHIQALEGATLATSIGDSSSSVSEGHRVYLRIARSGTVYHCLFSLDGYAWTELGKKTLGTAPTRVWIYYHQAGTVADPPYVGMFKWFRLGTNDYDPW